MGARKSSRARPRRAEPPSKTAKRPCKGKRDRSSRNARDSGTVEFKRSSVPCAEQIVVTLPLRGRLVSFSTRPRDAAGPRATGVGNAAPGCPAGPELLGAGSGRHFTVCLLPALICRFRKWVLERLLAFPSDFPWGASRELPTGATSFSDVAGGTTGAACWHFPRGPVHRVGCLHQLALELGRV